MDEKLLTALPYVDDEFYTEEMQSEVQRLIEAEMATFTPHDYLQGRYEADLDLSEHPLLQAEMERVGRGEKLDVLSFDRPKDKKDPRAWAESVEKARILIEYQNDQLENLELLKTYGANALRAFCEYNEKDKAWLDREVDRLEKAINELNLARKKEQTPVGQKLGQMENEWRELVAKNRSIASAIADLEAEILTLQRTKSI